MNPLLQTPLNIIVTGVDKKARTTCCQPQMLSWTLLKTGYAQSHGRDLRSV
jgi:hypothetical protein